MKILIAGNMGYVGASLVDELRESYPAATLVGYDIGYFAHCLTTHSYLPERKLDLQFFGDIREISEEVLKEVEVVVNLAAISNDPMGQKYKAITGQINFTSGIALAEMAKRSGVKRFIFASSCSIYGASEGEPRHEKATLNPLTAYARSKVDSEKALSLLADTGFVVTCLRFATACGMNQRTRLDLVLNDFVASAVASKRIDILSDGTPWRPLIHVKDMARAITWAISRQHDEASNFLVINTGSNHWNFQIKDLAQAVADTIGEIKVSINHEAPPDKRSYQVSFDLFESIATDHQPLMDLETTVKELQEGLMSINFKDTNFRNSHLIRLTMLTQLQEDRLLSSQLRWRSE